MRDVMRRTGGVEYSYIFMDTYARERRGLQEDFRGRSGDFVNFVLGIKFCSYVRPFLN